MNSADLKCLPIPLTALILQTPKSHLPPQIFFHDNNAIFCCFRIFRFYFTTTFFHSFFECVLASTLCAMLSRTQRGYSTLNGIVLMLKDTKCFVNNLCAFWLSFIGTKVKKRLGWVRTNTFHPHPIR